MNVLLLHEFLFLLNLLGIGVLSLQPLLLLLLLLLCFLTRDRLPQKLFEFVLGSLAWLNVYALAGVLVLKACLQSLNQLRVLLESVLSQK